MSPPPEAAHRSHLLVIDDDEAIGRLVRRVLAARYEVTVESAAAPALERILGGEGFDVILCDVTMPGMTGLDLYTHLREVRPATVARMVLMTGGGLASDQQAQLEALATPSIAKPFSPAALRTLVEDFLSRRDRGG